MNLAELQLIIDTRDVSKIIQTFDSFSKKYAFANTMDFNYKNYSDSQYDLRNHTVLNTSDYLDKRVYDETVDALGQPQSTLVETIGVARLPIPMQKSIVLTAAAFLGTPEIDSTPNNPKQTDLLTIINKVLEDNKFAYKFMSFVKKVKSEKKAAFLFYTVPLEAGDQYWAGEPISISTKFKIRTRVLSESCGDILYPFFDDQMDMIAFAREYKIKNVNSDGLQTEERHFDLYTDKQIIYSVETQEKWDSIPYVNLIGKIPIIYACQPLTDWEDVQPLIERLEVKTSKHADSNDYHDQPIVLAKGDVRGFSSKGESGKVLQMGEAANVSYLEYNSLPESMKMEIDNLIMYINRHTHTPDISFDQMKQLSIGTLSGYAIKLLFMDAHMKAYDSEEIFGEAAQRIYNYLKKAISIIAPEFKEAITLQLKPKFNYFLPKNDTETLANIKTALDQGIMSKQTAVKLNPLIADTESEKALLDKEQAAKDQKAKDLFTAQQQNNPVKPIQQQPANGLKIPVTN